MIVLTIVLAHVTHPSAVHADLSYEAYAQEISAELGPAYLEQYQQLTRGDYRYPPHTAQYMVYAFYHGWQAGYYAGSWAPYNRANGHITSISGNWKSSGRRSRAIKSINGRASGATNIRC